MQPTHTPRDGFVERLEWQISSELRRRHRTGPATWLPASPVKAAAAIVFLVLVSMTIGGVAVAAAIQAQDKERRDLVMTGSEQGLKLAELRVAAARLELSAIERQVAVGVERAASPAVEDARLKVAEAEGLYKVGALELQEVQVTGREPRDEISAPLVSGRDFVSERLQASLDVPERGLMAAKARVQAMRTRVDLGLAPLIDVAEAEARALELEQAVTAIRRKLDIRRQFVAGTITAPQADLRLIEAEAEQRVKSLEPRILVARQLSAATQRRFEVGLATQVELAEAKLRLSVLESDLAKAQLDLALIRKKISEF